VARPAGRGRRLRIHASGTRAAAEALVAGQSRCGRVPPCS
jgi:hypothetical protein